MHHAAYAIRMQPMHADERPTFLELQMQQQAVEVGQQEMAWLWCLSPLHHLTPLRSRWAAATLL